MGNQTLQAGKVVETVVALKDRISDRFPESGLFRICSHLEQIAKQTSKRAEWIKRPIWWVKLLVILLVVALFGVIFSILIFALNTGNEVEKLGLKEILELGDPVMNELFLIGALMFFLFSLETRIKRNRALKAIHELRSIAHVIDMHQLTKDPERVVSANYKKTARSPKASLDRFQLRRYLDYCSEMLSLTGKLAALYVQNFDDEVALASVNEIETLTTGLSRKIWQKIMILHSADDKK